MMVPFPNRDFQTDSDPRPRRAFPMILSRYRGSVHLFPARRNPAWTFAGYDADRVRLQTADVPVCSPLFSSLYFVISAVTKPESGGLLSRVGSGAVSGPQRTRKTDGTDVRGDERGAPNVPTALRAPHLRVSHARSYGTKVPVSDCEQPGGMRT